IDSTGPNTIVDNEITLASGGQTVTLDLRLSGWGDTIGAPSLAAYQATVDSGGYTSGTGDALNPLGWPGSPTNGAYIATSVCLMNERPCVPPESDCDPGTEGFCIHNPDFVFLAGNSALPAVATTTLNYTWGAVASEGSRVDGGDTYHGGLLKVDVPPGAAGTYTIDFVDSPNETFMTDSGGGPITPIDRIPALIILSGPDCNGNAIPDPDDIANCTGEPACGDCNFNEIPDECDIDDLTSDDCNNNGIPDECEDFSIIYVQTGAVGANNGTSWTDAFFDLQDAFSLAACASTDAAEIWVGAGTYHPDDGADVTPGNRTETFQLVNDTQIYGGFAGFETLREQRNTALNVTILSGDLAGDDAPVACTQNSPDCDSNGGLCVGGFCIINQNNSENSFHVTTGSGTDATAILDGFTITGGNADGTNPDDRGGGMHNDAGSPTVTNCTFKGNSAVNGGGMFNVGSDPTVTSCTISGNSAINGGGTFNSSSSPTITNCTISGNSAIDGGGLWNESTSNPPVTNCTFAGNSAINGGGMANDTSSPVIANCIFWDNNDAGGMDESAQIHTNSGTPVVNYSIVQGGWAGAGGAGNLSSNPMFDAVKGNLSILLGSPAIEAGDNTAVPADTADVDGDGDTVELLPLDLDGNRRFVDELLTVDTGVGPAPIVDMGAFEAFRDCNMNGVGDDLELVPGGVNDCNNNSNLDSCDIASGSSSDCNNNGVPDSCDIASGTSDDCNDGGLGNGIPDECDIANCPLNFEGSPQDCDDCNNNEVLDECDIFGGSSLDDDMNGRPDECKDFDDAPDRSGGQNLIVGPGSSWGLDTNWEGDTRPDETNSVIIDSTVAAGSRRVAFVVDLDISASVASARLLGGSTLNVTGGFEEDLTIGTDGIFVQGDIATNASSILNVSNDRVVDVPSGPITIGAAGEIVSSNDTDPNTNSLVATSIDIRNGSCECPATSGGSLTLNGTSIETTGDVVLVPQIGAICTTSCGLSRGGTTPPILEATASFASIGGDLTMNAREGAGGARGGTTPPILRILAGSLFDVGGSVTINDGEATPGARGGTTPPILKLDSSTLSAVGDFTMNGRGGDSFARGGTTPPILEAQSAFMTIGGDFTVNGPDRPSAGRGGTTPPILKLFNTELTIEGDFSLTGQVDLQGSVGREAGPVTSLLLGGNFNNHSLSPATFDLSTNLVTMDGNPQPQTMEAAGENRGAGTLDLADNYLIGELVIASDADVTLSDSFDNDGLGQTVPEVQYVDTLTIRPGGTLTIVDTTLFYSNLNGDVESIIEVGFGLARELFPSLPEACCLPSLVCVALPAIDCTFIAGVVSGPACGGDADGDGIAEACDICPAGDNTIDENNNGIPDACEVEPPIRAAAPHDILKNRYISIDPRGATGNNPPNLHIRVQVDSSQVNGLTGSGPWWANDPVNGGGLSPPPC
ncbi:MAG: right-handed parallel beta-helix repeat-containing protein, partial [Planctomycetes bacterium]|nr:right-handed parallel beta-helix repeat-containing protein [Planctomycetota bacterium]